MTSAINWIDDKTFELGDVRFHLDLGRTRPASSERLILMKDRPLVDCYERMFAGLQVKRVVELGIWGGGGTIFLERLLKPEKLVAIDRAEERVSLLDEYIARLKLESVVSCRYGLWQEQATRLADAVKAEFDSAEIDVVVDDASHLLDATRASFNCLFPRLAPGGVYIIEDWAWAHWPGHYQEGDWAKREPLSRLVFQAGVVVASFRQIVSSVRIEPGMAVIQRGPAAINPQGFDLAKFCRFRGEEVLGLTLPGQDP